MDDGRPRDSASGDAEGRRQRPHARFSALGQSAVVAENDGAALSGRQGRPTFPRSSTTTAPACASCAGASGAARPDRRRRRGSALSRCLGAAGQAERPAGGRRAACFRLCVRGLRRFRGSSAPLGVLTEKTDGANEILCASGPATGRWCCSTAATRSRCRPASAASAFSWSPASRSRSRSPGTARS